MDVEHLEDVGGLGFRWLEKGVDLGLGVDLFDLLAEWGALGLELIPLSSEFWDFEGVDVEDLEELGFGSTDAVEGEDEFVDVLLHVAGEFDGLVHG